MTVRLRLALTVLLTGVFTALAVSVTVALAFMRFEHESTYARADAFLGRVVGMYEDLLDLRQTNPQDFNVFLRNLLLFEPDSQLYLLAADGTVLAHTASTPLAPGFKVSLGPVQQSAAAAGNPEAKRQAPYVMGDDPEKMDADAVVAARPLKRAQIRAADPVAGYLYIVCRKPRQLGTGSALFRSSFVVPALLSVAALIVLGTLLAVWIIGTVTKPLRVLSDEVAAASREGFGAAAAAAVRPLPLTSGRLDEFGHLRQGFHVMLAALRKQWDELRRLDHFRRESVSNLSHDLRSPLTATVACLETLEQRWAEGSAGPQPIASAPRTGLSKVAEPQWPESDRRLVAMALRNTRNAAGMVRSLGDLALLDEPEFKLRPTQLDLGEVLDDITMRFAERARQQGVSLGFEQRGSAALVAEVDVELFERAVANLLDNALKFTPAGGAISLQAEGRAGWVTVEVADAGSGIPEAELPHLFDRHYQSRSTVAPASSAEGKGLGLAIVKRIVELHRGQVAVASRLGQGTTVTIELPAA